MNTKNRLAVLEAKYEELNSKIIALQSELLIHKNYEAYKVLGGNHYDIPSACKGCSNHPSNGGSGICHCTLGGYDTYTINESKVTL